MQTQLTNHFGNPRFIPFDKYVVQLGSANIKGKLGMMAAPDSNNLVQQLTHFKQSYNCDTILTLLTEENMNYLGLDKLPQICADQQIDWVHAPIQDCSIPDDIEPFYQTVAAVGEKIRDEGKSVLVHCEHGRGRTGLTACCILVYLGFEVENAITTVQKHNGHLITTKQQKNFCRQFAQKFSGINMAKKK